MDFYDIFYADPAVHSFSMVWGWGGSYDDGWYSLTGGWHVNGFYLNNNKNMIAGLAVSE